MKLSWAGWALLVVLPGAAAAQETVVFDAGTRAGTLAVDPTGKALTIRTEAGPSVVVEDAAVGDLRGVEPGDTLTISVRDPATGRRHIVNATVNGTVTAPAGSRRSGRASVLEPDPGGITLPGLHPGTRKLTVVGSAGERKVFDVRGPATITLPDVRPGQEVVYFYRFDRDAKLEAVVRVRPPDDAPAPRRAPAHIP